MNVSQPTLTIAIPTVSVPESLFHSLKVCRAELASSSRVAEVEILVSVNNIEKINQSTVRELEALARVVVNDGPGDYDSHINFLIKMSRGRFVKILADDDRLLAGSLDVFLDAAHSAGEVEFFYHEFETNENQLHGITEKLVFRPALSASKLVSRSVAWGQVSSVMCLRDAWLSSPMPPKTNYIHCFKLQHALLEKGPSVVAYCPHHLVHVSLGSPHFSKSADQRVSIGFNGLLVHKLLQDKFGLRMANLMQANMQLNVVANIVAHSRATEPSFRALKYASKMLWFPFLPGSILLFGVLIAPREILRKLRALSAPKPAVPDG